MEHGSILTERSHLWAEGGTVFRCFGIEIGIGIEIEIEK